MTNHLRLGIKASLLYSDNFASWHLRYSQHPKHCSPSTVEFALVVTSYVMGPLREYTGLEGFLPVVDKIQFLLDLQRLTDLHEVEIALLRHGRVCLQRR